MEGVKNERVAGILERCEASGVHLWITDRGTIAWAGPEDLDPAIIEQVKRSKPQIIEALRDDPVRKVYDPFTRPPENLRGCRFRRLALNHGEPVGFAVDPEGEFIWGDHVQLYVFADALERWKEVYG